MVGPEQPNTPPAEETQGAQAALAPTLDGDCADERPKKEPELEAYSQTLLNIFFDR